MAFFDRLKEKTGDMIEISKINSKISEEKRKLQLIKQHWLSYWTKFENGEVLDEVAALAAIVDSNNAIRHNREIKRSGRAGTDSSAGISCSSSTHI